MLPARSKSFFNHDFRYGTVHKARRNVENVAHVTNQVVYHLEVALLDRV